MPSQPLPYEATMMRRRRHVVALPEDDAIIEATPATLRIEVAQTWGRRAHEELKVAAAFTVLCRELLEIAADPAVIAVVARAVSDEVRHGEVCRALAAKYRGGGVAWPPAVVIDPSPAKGDRFLRAVFHMVSMCCVNEALASKFLEVSLAGARSPSARAAVGELLADEVEHARVGWVFVAKQPASVRDAIEANLLPLVKAALRCWWDEGPVTLLDGAPDHGIPSVRATRQSALAAVHEVIAPGFEQLGIDSREIREWATHLGAAMP